MQNYSVRSFASKFKVNLEDSSLFSWVWKSHAKGSAPSLVAISALVAASTPSRDHRPKWLITDLHRAERSHVFTYEGGLSGGLKVSSFLKRIFRVPRATERYSVPRRCCHFAARLAQEGCVSVAMRDDEAVRGCLLAHSWAGLLQLAWLYGAAPFRREIARYRRWSA